jgi:hypothetical protein
VHLLIPLVGRFDPRPPFDPSAPHQAYEPARSGGVERFACR